MANRENALVENVPGEFFVDSTCIDCGTCRRVAPAVFDEIDAASRAASYSFVYQQPQNDFHIREALQALIACPTGSIGTLHPNDAKAVMSDFPLPLEEFTNTLVDGLALYYCGFTSPKSFGGSSYFLRHQAGNWLIDSPKFIPQLKKRFEEMGGIRYIFLTHSDDVAEAARFAEHFGAERIIHEQELWSQPVSERVLEGFDPVTILPGFQVIPTPGHTRGHCVLHVADRYLFTGDHMWWNPKTKALETPQRYLWSQAEIANSTRKLADYEFEWVLPGHGHPVHLPSKEMKGKLLALVAAHANS